MNTSLLSFLYCPNCHEKLLFLPFSFKLKNIFSFILPKRRAKGQSLSGRLGRNCLLSENESNKKAYKNGLLICCNCNRWYPVINFLPEILPDHLRDWGRDLDFLEKQKWQLDSGLKKYLRDIASEANLKALSIIDKGLKFKQAEMNIKDKVDDLSFFGPGHLAPFNPNNPEFTRQLIRRFGQVVHLLGLEKPATILDVGAGYAWTSEWLARAGHKVIGIDICRTYLEIGLERMIDLSLKPDLFVADVEYLPLQSYVFDYVLCFDTFHHIPDRKKALYHLWRTLKPGGQIVLAEPGPQHEKEASSIEVMNKYGILEKGMSLEDVQSYTEDLKNVEIKQIFIIDVGSDELGSSLSPAFLESHKFADCNYYVIKKSER